MRGRSPRAVLALFGVTLFLSAALTFAVQPMVGRLVLPSFGSTPAVWNTCLLFFQVTLLGGYLYSHLAVRRLGVRRQAAAHLCLALLPLLVLPIALPADWTPPADANPIPSLLGVLAVAAGLPFLVVSATAPLLQRWLADTGHPAARDPYFLYAASNLGSAVGLIGYPLAIEPQLRLEDQGWAWTGAYVGLLVLVLGCALVVWRSPSAPAVTMGNEGAAGEEERPSWKRRLRWLGLAAAPSSLLLGVTSFLTTDLAPAPLLWVVPLFLYLVSFVLAFSGGAVARAGRRAAVPALPVAVVAVAVLLLLEVERPLWLVGAVHLIAFLIAGLACHGRLADDRPGTAALTEFYLWVAVGGAAGGAFNALVAPAVFEGRPEYPLALAAVCLALPLRPRFPPTGWSGRLDVALPLALGLVVVAVLVAIDVAEPDRADDARRFLLGLAAGACLNFARRPLRLALGVGALLLAGTLAAGDAGDTLFRERTFYGVHRVVSEDGGSLHRLLHGTTTHGVQWRDPRRATEPLSYYHRSGPIGDVVASLRERRRLSEVAVVGLGTGAMACHSRRGERWTFYEIDPTVERIARDRRFFTYLRDCAGTFDVVLGDARLSLRRSARRRFGLLIADAFTSDAIPVHLLTREALDLYRARLDPTGVVAFHVSNRYVDLEPVLGALARQAGLACRSRFDEARGRAAAPGRDASHWVALAAQPGHLGRVASAAAWRACRSGGDAWTDDYSNLAGALRLGGGTVEDSSLTPAARLRRP